MTSQHWITTSATRIPLGRTVPDLLHPGKCHHAKIKGTMASAIVFWHDVAVYLLLCHCAGTLQQLSAHHWLALCQRCRIQWRNSTQREQVNTEPAVILGHKNSRVISKMPLQEIPIAATSTPLACPLVLLHARDRHHAKRTGTSMATAVIS